MESDTRNTAVAPARILDVGGASAIAEILEILRQGERFMLCSHSRPDGDAVGSLLAMKLALEQMGKRAVIYTADHIPAVFRSLPGAPSIQTVQRVRGSFDAAILLECDSTARTRLLGLEPYFLINIDHHASGRNFARVNWIDRHAASVGELVYRLIQAAKLEVTPEIATCLYTTILTDTGAFCYGSTTATTFELARDLVAHGADPVRIAQDVFYSTTPSRLLLLGSALSHLRREGRVAWLFITHEEYCRACAADEDCEGIVNYAISIAGVEAAVFLRELPEGLIRLSIRSKGRVDVAAIAESLGGGGHLTASGCTLEGSLSEATAAILAKLRPAVAAACQPCGE